jgi:tetratricopeptide (TPR) repeat protein
MAKLSHPNVVQVYEVGQLEGRTFVAMELVKGQTVRQWLAQEPRPGWRACVEVFLQLGQGLAEAHRRGLVHRDFKPGNAIIDEEGRARVLDFGLARRGEDGEDEPSTIQRLRASTHASGSLDQPLTQTGAVMGTPAYMPIEQMDGLPADARSDQFSFCVALFEAVYGERPYEGDSMVGLMAAMYDGRVRPAPRDSKAPAALRKVLLRGLSTMPSQRWPSMEVLLEELRRVAMPRRLRWTVLAVVGLLGLGVGLWAARALEWVHRCSGAQGQLAGVWDDARRQEVKAAILGTGLSYASGTWERLEPRIDEYAEAWVAEHTDTCEATRLRDEQSEEEMSLRMACLHARSQHLGATIDELRHADATVVTHAVQAVASLPGLSRCRDLEALRAEVPPPEGPEAVQKVAALDERLVEAKAKEAAGRYEDAQRLVDEVVVEAGTLGYEPLSARAWLRQGSLREKRGRYEEAVEVLRKAYGAAVAHSMKAEAAEASTRLSSISGSRLAWPQEARIWAEHAEALARAAGTDEALAMHLDGMGALAQAQGEYEQARRSHARALAIREKALGPEHPDVATSINNLGIVAQLQGEHASARELFARALAIREQALGPEHPDVATSINNLGIMAHSQGEHERARELLERALAILEEALGPEHPNVADSLDSLGIVARSQGAYADARMRFERALAIREQALGPTHPDVAITLDNLGTVADLQGEHERAHTLFERALAIREEALGPGHPDVAASLANLGIVLQSQGKHEDALALYVRALGILEQALGPEHPDVAYTLVNLGTVAQLQGNYESARSSYARALAILEEALGPTHPAVATSLVGLGEVLLALDDPTEALPLLERALAMHTLHEIDPASLAYTRFTLACALWAAAPRAADHPRARALAEQALAAYALLGDAAQAERTAVQAWLDEHRFS